MYNETYELLKLNNFQKEMEDGLRGILPLIIQSNPELSVEDTPEAERALNELLKHIDFDAVKIIMVKLYEDNFTHDEIKQLVKLNKEYPVLLKSRDIMTKMGPAAQIELLPVFMAAIAKIAPDFHLA